MDKHLASGQAGSLGSSQAGKQWQRAVTAAVGRATCGALPGSGSLLLSCMINGMENAWSYGRLTTSVVSSQLFSTGIYYMAEKR